MLTNAPSDSPSTAPALAEGAILRRETGELYRLEGFCKDEGLNERKALIQALGRARTEPPSLCRLDDVSTTNLSARFLAVPAAAKKHLTKFWRTHFRDTALLDQLLLRYEEPWRFAYGTQYVFRLFERATELGVKLSLEEGLALLLFKLNHLPTVPWTEYGKLADATARSIAAFFPPAKVDWAEVTGYWSADTPSNVRDLLLSPLAGGPIEFCIGEDLQWLDALPVVAGRKEFDTSRLKELLGLAAKGPLFTALRPELEKAARINLEGLRQAWLKKYSA